MGFSCRWKQFGFPIPRILRLQHCTIWPQRCRWFRSWPPQLISRWLWSLAMTLGGVVVNHVPSLAPLVPTHNPWKNQWSVLNRKIIFMICNLQVVGFRRAPSCSALGTHLGSGPGLLPPCAQWGPAVQPKFLPALGWRDGSPIPDYQGRGSHDRPDQSGLWGDQSGRDWASGAGFGHGIGDQFLASEHSEAVIFVWFVKNISSKLAQLVHDLFISLFFRESIMQLLFWRCIGCVAIGFPFIISESHKQVWECQRFWLTSWPWQCSSNVDPCAAGSRSIRHLCLPPWRRPGKNGKSLISWYHSELQYVYHGATLGRFSLHHLGCLRFEEIMG